VPSVPSLRARTARTSALVVLALLLTALGASPAAAHNTLRSTDPADASTVPSAPAQVTLTFDQPAMALGTQVVVTGPDGAVVSEGAVQLVDASVVQPLVAELPAGTYTVDWRVTSADGHPLSGAFAFTAAEAVGAAEPTPAEPTADAPADVPASSDDPADAPADDPADDPADETSVTAVPISAPADTGPAPWVWALLGAGALAVVVAGAAALVVARRRADAADAADAAGQGGADTGDPDGTGNPTASA